MSMMERLILNRLESVQLCKQSRMLPDLRSLLEPIYPDLFPRCTLERFHGINPDAFSLVVGSQVVVLSDVPRKSTQQCLLMIVGPRADKRCDNGKMTTQLKAPECVASPVFFWDCRDPEASSDRSLVNETEQLDLESPTWACLSGVGVFGRPHKPSLLKVASGSRSK